MSDLDDADEDDRRDRHVEVIDIRALIGDYSSSEEDESEGAADDRSAIPATTTTTAATLAKSGNLAGVSKMNNSGTTNGGEVLGRTPALAISGGVPPLAHSARKASFIKPLQASTEQPITVAYSASPRRHTDALGSVAADDPEERHKQDDEDDSLSSDAATEGADETIYDEKFLATATREQLVEAIKGKDAKIATGKTTISTLIEQITDYQSLMEQEKEALARDVRKEREIRADLQIEYSNLQEGYNLLVEQFATLNQSSKEQSQETINNLRTLMAELESIEEQNNRINQQLQDERDAHAMTLQELKVLRAKGPSSKAVPSPLLKDTRDIASSAPAATNETALSSASPVTTLTSTTTSTAPAMTSSLSASTLSTPSLLTSDADAASAADDMAPATAAAAAAAAAPPLPSPRRSVTQLFNKAAQASGSAAYKLTHAQSMMDPASASVSTSTSASTSPRKKAASFESSDDSALSGKQAAAATTGRPRHDSGDTVKPKRTSKKTRESTTNAPSSPLLGAAAAAVRKPRSGESLTSTSTAASGVVSVSARASGGSALAGRSALRDDTDALMKRDSGSASASRDSSPTRRRHRRAATLADDGPPALQFDEATGAYNVVGGTVNDDSSDTDAEQLRRELTNVQQKLLQIRSLVNDALSTGSSGSGIGASSTTASSASQPPDLITPRGSRTTRALGAARTPGLPRAPSESRMTPVGTTVASAASRTSTSSTVGTTTTSSAMSHERRGEQGVRAIIKARVQSQINKIDAKPAPTKSTEKSAVLAPPPLPKTPIKADHELSPRGDSASKSANANRSIRDRVLEMGDAVVCLTQANDGSVWVGCDDGHIVVFDAKTRDKLAALVPAQPARPASPSGSLSMNKVGVSSIVAVADCVWSVNREGSVIIWSLADKAFKQIKSIAPPNKIVKMVAVDDTVWCNSNDQKLAHGSLVWVGTESRILRFDVNKRELHDSLVGHEKTVQAMCVVRDGGVGSGAQSDSTPATASSASTSASGGYGVDTVWSASLDGKLLVWHSVSGALLQTFDIQQRGIALVQAGERVWMSCRDNRIAVFDINARKFEQFLTGLHTGLINAMLAVVSGVSPAGLAVMPRGRRSVAVWTASSDKTLGCWPANSLVKKAHERAVAATKSDAVPETPKPLNESAGRARWVSAVCPNEHTWHVEAGADRSEDKSCINCSSDVVPGKDLFCSVCKKYCHADCRDSVPQSCGVDPAKQLLQRVCKHKLDSRESDLFMFVPTAFTAPGSATPGRIIVAHCVSVKGSKASGVGEFASIGERYPLAKSEFVSWFTNRAQPAAHFLLGSFQLVEVEEDVFVANVLAHDGSRIQPRALRAALLDLMLHAIKCNAIVHLSKHGWGDNAFAFVAMLNELPALRVWIHDTRPTSVSSAATGSWISKLGF